MNNLDDGPETEEEIRKKQLNKTLAVIAVVMFALSFAWHIVPIIFGSAS